MQLGPGWHASGKLGLNVHVHILQFSAPFEFAFCNVRANALKAGDDSGHFFFLKQPNMVQHARMGNGAGNVVMRQARVEFHRVGKGDRFGRRAIGKPAAAGGDLAGFFLRHGEGAACRDSAAKSRRFVGRYLERVRVLLQMPDQ